MKIVQKWKHKKQPDIKREMHEVPTEKQIEADAV